MIDKLQTEYSVADILPNIKNRSNVEEFICKNSQNDTEYMPLYTKYIVAIGAYIAVMNFLAFFGISKIINFNNFASMLGWGSIFVLIGIFIYKKNNSKYKSIKQNFLIQLSFVLVGVGKIFIVWGIAIYFKNEWAITGGLLLVTLATYNFYPSSIDRFFSSFLTILSIIFIILYLYSLKEFKEPAINIIFVICLAGSLFLLLSNKTKQKYIPLAYSALFSSLIIAGLFAASREFGFLSKTVYISDILISMVTAIALIGIIAWVIGGFDKILKRGELILATIAIVIGACFTASGILFSILLLVLGYALHDRVIKISGFIFLPIFISNYYYNIDISLLYKSGVLIASGFVLLLGYYYMVRKKLI